MKQLVDVVNFNADASCLSCRDWHAILKGGGGSQLVQWLNLYVQRQKKVVLGFPGATVADIATCNPEALSVINGHPDVFEVILRPFSHDIALLRSQRGFILNFTYGEKVIRKEFVNICDYFLPPEFMLTNEQIVLLKEHGVAGTFINPARFSLEIKRRIPGVPYQVRGLFGTDMDCIPFRGRLTDTYLYALHTFDCSRWNGCIGDSQDERFFAWRDGESSFFLPDGQVREDYWLMHEDAGFERMHLKDLHLDFMKSDALEDHQYKSYPVHSFSAWMKEFRMLGFVSRLQNLELLLEKMTEEQVHLWLLVINSDILSATEKKSPVVTMRESPVVDRWYDNTIQRSERGFEGEEYLAVLELTMSGKALPDCMHSSLEPHLVKWRDRVEYLMRLGDTVELDEVFGERIIMEDIV